MMTIDSCGIHGARNHRPEVTGLAASDAGAAFTIRFAPGQSLPPHHNKARVVLTAVRGTGTLTVDGVGERELYEGATVRLEQRVGHAVTAGAGGLELLVELVPDCCSAC